ncbi:hypothetical protein V5O48_014802 [Marasmius crinis-equi]|uniref:Uncharacterized protein n=1 Tax=Marasmius crinis-equi TaxID=585013 RepID=A0ABR3EW94_9AGAR
MKFTFNLVISALALLAQTVTAATNVPVDPAGDVVAIQSPTNKPTWIVYQNRRKGNLVAMRVSGPFSDGQLVETVTAVPANRVLFGTPLAIAQQSQEDNDPGKVQLFFFDRDNILSEARWTKERGWYSGSDCPVCIDQKTRYQAVLGSKVLYAGGSNHKDRKAGMRVGFQSADYPDNTLAEADRQDAKWVLAPLTQA